MLSIKKITSNSTVDYAAEELKKYLRMMMPEGGDIKISYDPKASDGFRLGLMQDFGLDCSDADECDLDDILYIDTTSEGGIIAGDNPRSVLLAVYEYLRQNGCRWLFPGVDGEYIPMQDIVPVKYRHKPSCRYRGQCNEGSEFQEDMIAAIEFTPKVGMNVFMMEFEYPVSYYRRYYTHLHNEENRPAEPITRETVLQYKRQCEAEIAKRGLQFHDIGHGWHMDGIGIDSSVRDCDGDNDAKISDDSRRLLALWGGKRKLFANTPNYSQACYGNPETRTRIAKYVANYAKNHQNSDYLHVWLGDATEHQCECELCQKKIVSDWYIMLLNEIDEELTKAKLETRIVFIVYVETTWAPLVEKLNNPKRFALLFAPITRSYTETLTQDPSSIPLRPYVTNKNIFPENLAEYLAYLGEWKKSWKGVNLAYEYHFWRQQYFDVCGIELSKRINEDVKLYKQYDINGIIEDGSQRSFFPNGLAFYTYARTLFDTSLSQEQIAEDYYSHAYGKDWRKFYDYLEELANVVDFRYMNREKSSNPDISPFYNPDHANTLRVQIPKVLEKGKKLIDEHYNSPVRIQTVSVRLLEFHQTYISYLAECLAAKADGKDDEANALFAEMKRECGKQEIYFEKCYDQGLAGYSIGSILSTKSNISTNDDVLY